MKTIELICAALLLAGPAAAFAHGSENHDKPANAPVVKEQSPGALPATPQPPSAPSRWT